MPRPTCSSLPVWYLQALDELHAGVFDNHTYEQIKEIAPAEYRARNEDKLRYRWALGMPLKLQGGTRQAGTLHAGWPAAMRQYTMH